MPHAPVLASQVSSVHELPSLQSVADEQQPGTDCVRHVPEPVSQTPVMHAEGLVQSALLWQQPVIGLQLQVPALQASAVQGLASLQSVGPWQQFGSGAWTHCPEPLQVSVVHVSPSSQAPAVLHSVAVTCSNAPISWLAPWGRERGAQQFLMPPMLLM